MVLHFELKCYGIPKFCFTESNWELDFGKIVISALVYSLSLLTYIIVWTVNVDLKAGLNPARRCELNMHRSVQLQLTLYNVRNRTCCQGRNFGITTGVGSLFCLTKRVFPKSFLTDEHLISRKLIFLFPKLLVNRAFFTNFRNNLP